MADDRRNNETPRCEKCGVAADVKISLTDRRRDRKFRVYECPNCGKLIWEEE